MTVSSLDSLKRWLHRAPETIQAPADEVRALRELREVCGMYCERLPLEVREALHAIPEIEKTHRCRLMQ